jgi:hypothetical protein
VNRQFRGRKIITGYRFLIPSFTIMWFLQRYRKNVHTSRGCTTDDSDLSTFSNSYLPLTYFEKCPL